MEIFEPTVTGALVSLIISVAVGIRTSLHEKNWRTVPGRIVFLKEELDCERQLIHYPLIEFFDSTGKIHSFTHKLFGSSGSFKVGNTVLVVHDPSNPEKAHLKNFTAKYFISLIILFIGCMFVLACLEYKARS